MPVIRMTEEQMQPQQQSTATDPAVAGAKKNNHGQHISDRDVETGTNDGSSSDSTMGSAPVEAAQEEKEGKMSLCEAIPRAVVPFWHYDLRTLEGRQQYCDLRNHPWKRCCSSYPSC